MTSCRPDCACLTVGAIVAALLTAGLAFVSYTLISVLMAYLLYLLAERVVARIGGR